jgi:hypothetical protein
MFNYARQRRATVRRMLLVLAAIAAAALCGCTDSIIMRNPATGETTDCGGHYAAGLYAFSANQRAETCVADYRAQGWLRAPR